MLISACIEGNVNKTARAAVIHVLLLQHHGCAESLEEAAEEAVLPEEILSVGALLQGMPVC